MQGTAAPTTSGFRLQKRVDIVKGYPIKRLNPGRQYSDEPMHPPFLRRGRRWREAALDTHVFRKCLQFRRKPKRHFCGFCQRADTAEPCFAEVKKNCSRMP